MLEQAIQAKIIKLLISLGFDVIKIIRCNRTGVADIIACAPDGKFWAIEVKRQGGVVSALQAHYITEITRRHGIAFVAYSVTDVIDKIATVNPQLLAKL